MSSLQREAPTGSDAMTGWGKRALVAVGIMAYLACLVFFASVLNTECGEKPGIPAVEKYDELEFVVVHRPHVTYFVDIKFSLCFATRKPDYQDLVKFTCTDRLMKEVEESLQARAIKTIKKDAGR